MIKLTPERLREILHYDPETGIFTRLTRAARSVHVGDTVGSRNSEGYLSANIYGRSQKLHRLAWLYVHGAWPPALIDHINGKRDDNRISNLRLATRSDNLANSRIYRKGRTLPKGVSRRGRRWCARIQRDKKPIFIGVFDSIEEAISAYRSAAQIVFGPFRRTA